MKIDVAFVPGFSAALAGWEATVVVGGRGSLQCHWLGSSGPEHRSKRRHGFALDPDAFSGFANELQRLPERFQSSVIDDAPVRRIRLRDDGLRVERSRYLRVGDASSLEAAFDRVWFELFSQVRPALLELGMDAELVRQAR